MLIGFLDGHRATESVGLTFGSARGKKNGQFENRQRV